MTKRCLGIEARNLEAKSMLLGLVKRALGSLKLLKLTLRLYDTKTKYLLKRSRTAR